MRPRPSSARPSASSTFEPHPRSFFAPDAPPFRLMTADAGARQHGEARGRACSTSSGSTPPSPGSPRGLRPRRPGRGLGVRHVVVGADFRFGKGRAGDAAALARARRRLGFGVTAAPLVSDGEGGLFVDGDPRRAARRGPTGRGRPHPRALAPDRGPRSQHGEKRGRELGFPTANLRLDGLHLPRFGVYAALVDVLDGPHRGRYRGGGLDRGAADLRGERARTSRSICSTSTATSTEPNCRSALVAYLRPELRFDGDRAAGGADAGRRRGVPRRARPGAA